MLKPGSIITSRELTPVAGPPITVPDQDRLIHLHFRRFAGCPVCNLHLQPMVRRHAEIEAAGIREVVVFHSPTEELRKHTDYLPFALIADPTKKLYAEFGVESAPRALLSPRTWIPIIRGVTRTTWQILRGREHAPANKPHGGRLGLPGDFLIAPDGHIIACKYGTHAYDQWPVDELLHLATRHRISSLT